MNKQVPTFQAEAGGTDQYSNSGCQRVNLTFQVPVKWNGAEYKTDECKRREYLIRISHGDVQGGDKKEWCGFKDEMGPSKRVSNI